LRTCPGDDSTTAAAKALARNRIHSVGGLSLDRIATITDLYQLLKAFRMRPEPDDPRRNVPRKGDDELRNFHRRLLDVRDRLRTQRVKQIASRITEAALGVGSENRERHWEGGGKTVRPRARIADPRFAVCHAIVIESLTNYRPDDLRTRRENRQLMDWSSAKVQKFLREACQLHGLYLREVLPNYTSRQDSRTGRPGVRCDDVPIAEFLTAPWWRKAVNAAQKRMDANGTAAMDRLLVDLHARWDRACEAEKEGQRTLRVPRAGGDLFVSARSTRELTPARGGTPARWARAAVQADLNAAANIGLRPLLDPDWPGRWWYIPAVLSDDGFRIPNPDRCAGAACLEGWRVAQDRDGYTAHGTPLPLASEEDVQQAQAAMDRAETALKAAQQEQRRAMKGRSPLPPAEAGNRVEAAKAEKKKAGEQLSEVKKAARAKSHINLWRDPSVAPLDQGVWRGTAEYENRVRSLVIQLLRQQAGLPPDRAE
jgi:IS605 OrfB family transposase